MLIGVLALSACSLWLFIQDQRNDETRREQWIGRLTAERDSAQAALASLESRLTGDQAELLREEERVVRSTRVISSLDEMSSRWDRWFGNRAQQQANEDRRASMIALRAEANARIVELQTRVTAGHDGRLDAVLRLQSAELHLEEAARETSQVVYYLRSAWVDVRWYLAVGMLALVIGPFVFKLWLFYGWARWTGRSDPMQLTDVCSDAVGVGICAPCLTESLWPGEIMRVRPAVLATPTDELETKSRKVFSWAFPFTCWWSGLTGLRDLRHGHAGNGRMVPLSTSGEGMDVPVDVLVVVDVPELATFSVRLGNLAGWIFSGETPPRIFRRWRLWSRQAWVSRQLGYFVFEGPCRLILRGPGLRSELLAVRDGIAISERRVSNESVVGFSANLKVSPVRTERFRSFLAGHARLWQAKYTGSGAILAGDVVRPGFMRRLGRWLGI